MTELRFVPWLVVLVALGCASPAPTGQTSAGSAGVASSSSVQSNRVRDKGLEIWFELRPEVRADRVPVRVAVLHFHNVSSQPVRIYLPRGEAFRAGLSTLHFRAGDAVLVEPEPLPHGVVIEEADFPLIVSFDRAWRGEDLRADLHARSHAARQRDEHRASPRLRGWRHRPCHVDLPELGHAVGWGEDDARRADQDAVWR